jgi:aldehyde dehydrogenase (NAD+)
LTDGTGGTADAIAATVATLRATFEHGRTRPAEWRRRQLDAICRMLADQEPAFLDALQRDLHKAAQESWLAELSFVTLEARYAMRNLRRWMAPRRVRTPLIAQPGSSRVESEPIGLVLVIGAWNYPVQLTLAPMVSALAAGNCVLLKPSEVSAHTSALLARLLPQYLDPGAVAVIEGGVEETTAVLEHRFDHILYTGNGHVGRIVMTAAARHLTPVTLELGGKSPAIVLRSADLESAARRIAWGKWMNAGQTCVAPDYVLVEPAMKAQLVALLRREVERMYGSDPQRSPDYGRIVNTRHATRIASYMQQGTVAFGGVADVAQRYVAPTVLLDVPHDAAVLRDEIFGPVLPVLEVADAAAAIAYVKRQDKPLALYVFAGRQDAETVVEGTSSGMVCINDVAIFMAVPELPFGGVGPSGMGDYSGSHGFRTFSHQKPVMRRGLALDLAARYPPFSDAKLRFLKLVR